jgi:serine O-acetyltransferase
MGQVPVDQRPLKEVLRSHLRCQAIWRGAARLKRLGIPVLPSVMSAVIRTAFAAELPLDLKLHDEVVLMHNGLGVVIHRDARFDGPAVIFQHVTIGNRWAAGPDGVPSIGKYVFIGSGAVVVGPVTIGDFAVVGANAVVTCDVPAAHIVTGNPAVVRPLGSTSRARALFRLPPL